MKATLADAEKDGVRVPTTLEEYCVQASTSRNEENDDCILGRHSPRFYSIPVELTSV